MGFQGSSILFSFSVFCSFLLIQVSYAWGSTGIIHEAQDSGSDTLGWRGLETTP